MTRAARVVLGRTLALLALLGALARPAHAQPAPWRHWRTLETPHFRIHVERGSEFIGRMAAAAAETAYVKLARELRAPRGTIDLVVSDDADYSNGYAIVSPSLRIVVFAAPPIENAGLRLNREWLEIVIVHELAHVFHLDRTRGAWRVAQGLFGRAPTLFPNAYSPSWLVEGLAVYEESRQTGTGRLVDAHHRLYARAGAIEGKLFRLDQLSLGTSRFPAGEGAYAYGSLFLEWLAREHGDSSVRRFVDAQAAQLVPYWLDPAAKRAFGTPFGRAYRAWSDSVIRSVASSGHPERSAQRETRPPERSAQRGVEGPVLPSASDPLAGWRDLTTHGWFATSPRWVDDTTLVYTGSDGRETNAAYLVTTSGRRTRLGRRDTREASAPMPGGGFLYAQLDFTNPQEVRSDLYVERDGRTTRLTHGARLIQPDVNRRGQIVAIKLAATRSMLVLVDSLSRVWSIAPAGEEEVWAEPRWSPDGRRVVVAHRARGGRNYIRVVDAASLGDEIVAEGDFLLTAPSWTPDGEGIVYVSEESGTPALVVQRASQHHGPPVVLDASPTGIAAPQISPDGRWIAAVTLRADGYHIGAAPWRTATPPASAEGALRVPGTPYRLPAHSRDDFTPYSPWRTLLPRWWWPIVESAPGRGTRLGAETAGSDVVGRHYYSAYAALSTAGSFPVGGFGYRYAGLRRPLLDAGASQDYEDVGDVTTESPPQRLGTLLKRTRDASLAATFVRPRVRTSATLSVGAGVERRDFRTDPGQYLVQLDTSVQRAYTFPRVFVGATYANVQRPALSISQEDGVALAVTVRERWRTDRAARTRSTSAVASAAAFKSLDLPGFAHHVLALRLAGGVADRRAGTALEVGGTSGTVYEFIPGYTLGEGRRTFGVRGFDAASTYGTRAATATLEYRAPLVLASRGIALLPVFLDRTSLTAFGDWGIASCPANPLYASTCAPSPVIGRPIASAGAELGLGLAILDWDTPQTVRAGVAVPVVGRERVGAERITPYLAFGFSF